MYQMSDYLGTQTPTDIVHPRLACTGRPLLRRTASGLDSFE